MADHSDIEWTDATWNPITGCSVLSPGCTHCYAMKLAGTRLKHHPSRRGLTRDSKAGPVWTGEVRFNEGWLLQPIEWKRPRRIFVCAHGDLFHENVPDEWIDKVFAVMALAPQHTFQVLTKRAKRMREYFAADEKGNREVWYRVDRCVDLLCADLDRGRYEIPLWPLPNVCLGVSAERQPEADERIPELLATPAAVRFVSLEPLLGPIDLTAIRRTRAEGFMRPLDGRFRTLDWVIAGGESGQDARPMKPDWARSLRDQCAATGVPFFFKQWGQFIWQGQIDPNLDYDLDYALLNGPVSGDYERGRPINVGKKKAGRLLDGVEHNGMPKQLATGQRPEET